MFLILGWSGSLYFAQVIRYNFPCCYPRKIVQVVFKYLNQKKLSYRFWKKKKKKKKPKIGQGVTSAYSDQDL